MAGDDFAVHRRAILFLGLGVVLVALILNEFSLAFLFSHDGVLSAESRLKVRLLQAAGIAAGLLIVAGRQVGGRALARTLRRFPNVVALGLGLLSVVVVAGSVELLLHVRGIARGRAVDRVYVPPTLTPGTTSQAKLMVGGETIYDVTYSLDERYARGAPGLSQADTGKELIFFGGSFTFGEGVEGDETIPAVVGRQASSWRVTNYGFPGQGPAHMLQRLRDGSTVAALEGSDVKVVYVFIPGHVNRVIGSLRVSTSWGRNFPYYALTREGALEHRGTFADGRPWLSAIYGWVAREKVLHYYHVDFPARVRERDLELTTRIVEASRAALREVIPAAEFVVVLYPDQPNQNFGGKRMVPYLEKSGVEVLDYTELFGDGFGYWLDHDYHPNAKAHAELGARLARDLGFADE